MPTLDRRVKYKRPVIRTARRPPKGSRRADDSAVLLKPSPYFPPRPGRGNADGGTMLFSRM